MTNHVSKKWKFFVFLTIFAFLSTTVAWLLLDKFSQLVFVNSVASNSSFNSSMAYTLQQNSTQTKAVHNQVNLTSFWKTMVRLYPNDIAGIETLKETVSQIEEIDISEEIRQSYPYFSKFHADSGKRTPTPGNSTKIILFWTKLFGNTDWLLGSMGHEPFNQLNCSFSNCFVTDDRLYLDEADVVLINFRDDFRYSDIPFENERKSKQHWTFVLWESPEHTYHHIWQDNRKATRVLKEFGHFFNWTMTYRLDSDVPFNYGKMTPLETPDFSRIGFDRLKNKRKPVVWMNSHCSTPSNREGYVAELGKYIDVDIIGERCGFREIAHITKGPCKRDGFFTGTKSECLEHISENYKFYLAFENSLCLDYLTEKFYRAAKLDLIPVIYNGANMSLFAPNHSYINANDYSPEALAVFLKKVGSDSALYNSYFWWKPFFNIELRLFDDKQGFVGHHFCELCNKANQVHSDSSTITSYGDIDKWWTVDAHCTNGYVSKETGHNFEFNKFLFILAMTFITFLIFFPIFICYLSSVLIPVLQQLFHIAPELDEFMISKLA